MPEARRGDLIGLVGFADAGKSTAAAMLVQFGYTAMSFADPIKDCLAVIFGWPRHLLEGTTPESRRFRDTVDPWWAARLGIERFTPRYAMQRFGTDTMRRYWHDELWMLHAERRYAATTGLVVFTDVRHPPEIRLARRLGGRLIRIRRGDEPPWFETARMANAGEVEAGRCLERLGIHDSERAWIGCALDHTIANDGSIEQLKVALIAATVW